MSKLLINEPPLQVLPSLAVALDSLNEAIFLQQLHFMIQNTNQARNAEGKSWIRNTAEEWKQKQFPFWSMPTIARIIASLEAKKIISVRNDLNEFRGDRTSWLSINADELDNLLAPKPSNQNEIPFDQIDEMVSQSDQIHSINLIKSIRSNRSDLYMNKNSKEKEENIIVADEPQQPISSLDAQQLEPVGNSEQQPDAECNKRSGKRGKRSKADSDVAQDAEQPDHRHMWEALFYITHLHKDFKLSTKEMDMAIGKAAKKLKDLGYNIDDLRNWYRNIWSKEFPGLQNGQVQRATIGQICGGIGRIRNCTVPDSLSGPSTPTAPAAVGASVYKASPELER